jgi:hypothetical protein
LSLFKLDTPAQTPLIENLFELNQAILDALPLGVYACDVDVAGRISPRPGRTNPPGIRPRWRRLLDYGGVRRKRGVG